MDEVALCSDLQVRFFPASEAWCFLHELPIAGYSDRPGEELFHLNFSRFESRPSSSISAPFGKPQFDAATDSYGMEMLWSLGYVFRDKFMVAQGSVFGRGAPQKRLYDVFCTMWHKLKENHCYLLQDAWKEPLASSSEEPTKQSVAFAILSPNRIEFQPMQTMTPHRGFNAYPPEDWLLVHMRDYDGRNTIFCLDDATRVRFKQHMVKGIAFGKRSFRYFGSSNSQVKDQAAWFVALPPKESIDLAREKLGDLSSIKNVSTYISRVGLFLTTAKNTEV